MNDTFLIQSAIQGDLESYNRLVMAYQDLAYNQAFWMLKNKEAAEDITQDAFIQAYRRLSQFRGGSFRPWLLRIVTNACLDELRRWKRRPELPLFASGEDGEEHDAVEWIPDPGFSVEEIVENSELSDLLVSYLEELPDAQRLAVTLVDVLGYDYPQAAAALNVPLGTLKSRLARARLRLRERWVASHPVDSNQALSL